MTARHLSLITLLALTACEPIEVETSEPRGALLEFGRYDVVVKEVVDVSCDRDPGVNEGDVVPAELSRGEDGVEFRFAGWLLHGDMEPGSLHVHGEFEYSDDVPVEEDDAPDDVDYGDEDEDTDAPPPEEEEGEVGYEDEDDRHPVEHEGRPSEDVAEAPRASALLDARILESELAEGSLFLSVPGCEVELAVVIGRGGPHGERPVEERPDKPEEGEEGGGERPPVETDEDAE